MNSKPALTKVGKLDLEINRLSKFLFVFMICLSFFIVALSEFKGTWVINFFRFILLLSAIIPISMRVNLDMGKVYYCLGIFNDAEIPGTVPRNSTIPEELGRVQFLLTDKTGTLTKNDMIFKKLNMEFAAFDLDNLPDLRTMLVENCQQKRDAGPMSDICGMLGQEGLNSSINGSTASPDKKGKPGKKKGGLRRD